MLFFFYSHTKVIHLTECSLPTMGSPNYKLVLLCADIMLQMGFSQEEIQDSLVSQRYNDVMATYLLLDYRNSEVHSFSHLHAFFTYTYSIVSSYNCS